MAMFNNTVEMRIPIYIIIHNIYNSISSQWYNMTQQELFFKEHVCGILPFSYRERVKKIIKRKELKAHTKCPFNEE